MNLLGPASFVQMKAIAFFLLRRLIAEFDSLEANCNLNFVLSLNGKFFALSRLKKWRKVSEIKWTHLNEKFRLQLNFEWEVERNYALSLPSIGHSDIIYLIVVWRQIRHCVIRRAHRGKIFERPLWMRAISGAIYISMVTARDFLAKIFSSQIDQVPSKSSTNRKL